MALLMRRHANGLATIPSLGRANLEEAAALAAVRLGLGFSACRAGSVEEGGRLATAIREIEQ
jgi:hypothetical protein